MPTFTAIRATSFDEIAEFALEWDRLAALQRWPFAEFDWVRDCAAHLCADSSIAIHLVCHGTALAAAIALAKPRRLLASLELIGASHLYEATPVLSDHPDARARLIKELVAQGLPFSLARVLQPDDLEPDVLSAGKRKGYLTRRNPPGAPYLELPRTPEEFAKNLSPNRRSALSRKKRKLQSEGVLQFHSEYPGPETIAADLATFERIESQGWKGRRGSAIASRAGFRGFFDAAMRRVASDRRARIDRLSLNGDTIAIQFGIVSYNRYFLIKPTFDERFSATSPGAQLTVEAINHSIVEGLQSYEMLGSEDPWKLALTKTVRQTRTWIYYPYNLFGLTRLAMDGAGAVERKLWNY